MSRDSQRYRKTYSYYRVQPKTELLEVIVDETLDWKHSVRAASTASVSLAGSTPLTIDDVTLADEDRVLLKDQGSGAENGIYYFEVSNGSYTLTRASDARQDTISCGATTYVEEGAANSGKIFIMSTTGPITVGTTAMSWTLFSGVGGSGTTNYVSKFTASGSVGNSSIYDNSTGIGIGTTSFSGRFFVSGSDSAIPTAVIKGGYASLFDVQNFSGTSILFATGTLGSVGGRVGIGTSQPDAKFQVSSSYGGSAHGISIGKPNFLGLASNAYTSLQHNFYGGDGTTQRMMIDSAGNTILGGAFPGLTANTARLFVTGSSTAAEQGIVYRAGVASPTGGVGVLDIQNSSESSLLFVSASGFVGVGTNMGTSSASAAGSIFFVSSSLTGNAASAFIVGGQAFGTSVNISKAFTHLFWGAGGSTNEYMRINSAGNVGIGTSSGINSKLVVNGSASVTGSILPGASDTYPLGSSTNFWSTVYATNLTGSLTKLADGTSYLIAGSNVTITTGSNGAVTIESTAGGGGVGGSGTTNFIPKFTAGSTLGDSILQEGLGVNYTGTPNTAFLTSSGYGITFTQPQIWSLPDNSFGLNIDGKFKFDTGGGGSLGIGTPSTPGQKLHIVISEPSTDTPFVSDAPRVIRLQNTSTTANNSTSIVNADGSGSDINSFIQFINVDHSSDKGAMAFGTRDGASSGVRMKIDEAGNVGIGSIAPSSIGTDVFLFVSGSSGSLGTSTRGVAAFGGDVIVSGSLKVGTGSVLLTSNNLQFGASATRIEKVGNDLKFFDLNNTGGKTLSELAAGGSASPEYWASPTSGVIYATGSVGIGTTSPTEKFSVHTTGQDRVGFGVSSAVSTIYLGSTINAEGYRTIEFDRSAGSLHFKSGSVGSAMLTMATFDTFGRLGIGSTSPTTKLFVQSSSGVQIEATDGTTSQRVGYCLNSVAYSGTSTGHPYALLTTDVERMRIDTTGNVGIGTTSPVGKFDVQGNINFNSNSTTGGRQATYSLGVSDNGTVGQKSSISFAGTGTNGFLTNITFNSFNGDFYDATLTERMRIDSSGNVGIGTSTINARLDILSSDGDEGVIVKQGTTAPASATPILQAKGYDGGTVLWVSGSSTHGARVGIGTTNPRSICMLDVGSKGSTGTNNYVNVEASSTGECGYSWSAGGANPLWKFSRAASTSNISLIEQGSSNVALLCEYSTGYVGIGTNDPSEKLHVTSGSIKVDTAGYGVRLSSSPTNADAQTLDCYSESTISARLYALTGGGLTMSSNKNTLQVTKVGRLVTITGFLKIDEVTKPSVSGRLVIDMSVSSSPPLAAVQTAASVWIDQFDATMTDPVQAYIDTTDPYIYIDRLVNGSKADLASYVDTSSEVKILVTYVAA